MIADALYVGDSSVDRVMLGEVEVWSADPSGPTLPVVHITGTSGNASRDQFRAACITYGTTFNTVKVLPFLLDTSAATNLSNLLFGCSALTHAPHIDTTNVTTMGWMFANCINLVKVPDMQTGHIQLLTGMFYGCTLLTDGNVRLIGKHPSVDTASMLTSSGLTRAPFYNANGDPI